MVDLAIREQHLLRLLKESRDGGGASMACNGEERLAAAHELEELGLVEWHGEQHRSQFFYITDEGIKWLDDHRRGVV